MAKTARKGLGQKSSISQKSNPRFYTAPRPGGKSINTYQYNPSRRFSIAESSSSESSDGLAGKDRFRHIRAGSGSDSDSSLTAMSEEHEKAASRKGSVIFAGNTSKKSNIKERRQKGGKATKTVRSARKGIPGKTVYYRGNSSDEMSEDDDQSVASGPPNAYFYAQDSDDASADANDDNDEDKAGLAAIYSMVGGNNSFMSSQSEISNDEDSPDDEMDSSSSDDSEVDFVRLQVERKKNNVPVPKQAKQTKENTKADKPKRRKSSVYRRRSEVAIPEDINFKFEFDEPIAEQAVEDSDHNAVKEEEEDLGEEVADGSNDAHKSFDFNFDQPLIEVPKINEDELNSDDEYDFDDNDLLATLQADNDFEDFITDPKVNVARVRQGSLSSMNSMTSLNDDENEDSFLREEEKYLVNEFETNGFDEDDTDPGRLETAHAVNSLNEIGAGADNEEAVQYASSSDGGSPDSDADDDADDDAADFDEDGEYVDFIDFDSPFFDEQTGTDGMKEITSSQPVAARSKPKKAHFPKKKKGPLDSEEEDDSYLWNYFFSSDAESYSGSEIDRYDADEQLVLEEVFRQNLESRKEQLERESSMEPADSEHDQGYESGESTDVDLSLPVAGDDAGVGSKSAKEVLSSKTADYRPPILGTWAAIDSKPFGIIDGLSTRTLNNVNTSKPRTKNWRSFSIKNTVEDSAIELEELLNVSELDNEDENDARIWRDFNNNKKHVPLGAFRNKAHISHPVVVADPMTNYNVSKNTNFNTKRRYSNSQVKAKLASRKMSDPVPTAPASLSKDLNLPSKSKLRRASIADAVSEGYRPTKSGLFNENLLADVEEILGEDRDFMALVTGL